MAGGQQRRIRYADEIAAILDATTMAKVLRALVKRALEKDELKAMQLCLEYAYGKPVQPSDGQVTIEIEAGERLLGQMFQLQSPEPKAIDSRIVDIEPETPIPAPIDAPNPKATIDVSTDRAA